MNLCCIQIFRFCVPTLWTIFPRIVAGGDLNQICSIFINILPSIGFSPLLSVSCRAYYFFLFSFCCVFQMDASLMLAVESILLQKSNKNLAAVTSLSAHCSPVSNKRHKLNISTVSLASSCSSQVNNNYATSLVDMDSLEDMLRKVCLSFIKTHTHFLYRFLLAGPRYTHSFQVFHLCASR